MGLLGYHDYKKVNDHVQYDTCYVCDVDLYFILGIYDNSSVPINIFPKCNTIVIIWTSQCNSSHPPMPFAIVIVDVHPCMLAQMHA